MSGYVLQDTRTGKFVSRGGASSFVDKLQRAKIYMTREYAESERCKDSERIVSLQDLLS